MPRTSIFATQRPRTHLGLLAALGFVVALSVPWLVIVLANALPDKTVIAALDDNVTNWLMLHGTDSTDLLFKIVSHFGDWLLVVVVIGASVRFATRKQFPKVAALLSACVGAALLNVILAFSFRRAQSLAATSFVSVAQGVTFPSGHCMVALVAYGMLSYFVLVSTRLSGARQTASVGVTVLLVGLIGFARIDLGVHSLSDVVLGFAAGAVWLATCIVAYPRLVALSAATSAPSPANLQPSTA